MNRRSRLLSLLFCVSLLWSCSNDETDYPEIIEGEFNVTNIDKLVHPGDNFYQYAVGNWNTSNAGKTSVDKRQETMKKWYAEIFDKILEGKVPSSETVDEIKAVYQLYTDRSICQQCGVSVLSSTLDELATSRTTDDLIKIIVRLMKEGHHLPFSFDAIYADPSNRYMLQISATEFLPFLTADDLNEPDKVKYYSEFISKMLNLTGWNGGNEEEIIQDVLTLESEFNAYTSEETIIDYAKLKNSLPERLSQFIESLGVGDSVYLTEWHETELIIALLTNPEYFKKLKSYLVWCYVTNRSRYLTDEIFETVRMFDERIYGYSDEFEESVKSTLYTQFEVSLGKLYSEQMIPENLRNMVGNMADNIRNVFCDRIRNAAWLTEATKHKAIEKLEAIEVYVGGVRTRSLSLPDNYYDYTFQKSSEALNTLHNLIGKPVAKVSDDILYSNEVNAYYLSTNALCVSASFLQPPYVVLTSDLAAAYGTVGIVLGHEFAHSLDYNSYLFDNDYHYDWWAESDNYNYNLRANFIADYYSTLTFEGIPVDGYNTLNETMAELAGISLSYEAMLRVAGGKEQLDKNGFTLGQRFFLNYAYVFAGDYSNLIELYRYDSHIYPALRVNSTVANTSAWYEAFGIKPSDKSYIAPEKRVGMW